MKKMRYCVLLLLLTVMANARGQESGISGKVLDSLEGGALEYSSIALYQASDSALVTGVITDPTGHFKIENLKQGTYFLRAQFLGYETSRLDNIVLGRAQELDLGTITLRPVKEFMEEVTVTGNRINTLNKLDRQTYSAEQFETARGGTAVQVLQNMPSVAVNAQGEITVRGSSGFQVLVNGKPVLADAQTVLSQIPANMVDNVELITAPSARYDPDGKAGIINIITKKGAANGSGIRVNAQYGLPGTTDFGNERVARRYGIDLMAYYRKNKWDVTLGGSYLRNDLAGYREGDVFTENPDSSTRNLFPSNGERSFNRYNYNVSAAIGFTPDPDNIFTLGIFSGKRYQERDANLFYENSQWTLDGENKIYDSPYYNANNQIKQGSFTLGNLDYNHTFTQGSSITASILYEYDDLYGNTHNRNFSEPGGELLQYVRNPYQKPIRGFRFRLDYAMNLGNGKLESGYQFRDDKLDGSFTYIVTPESGQPDLERFRGTAVSRNRIHSVYSQYSASGPGLDYIFGLRYEYAGRTVDLSFDPGTHILNLSSFFPSANLLYHATPGLDLKAGFSRRIERSTNNQLNPIPEREHSETLEMGDPDLLPEFVNLLELGLTKKFRGGQSLFATAYFRSTKNPVQRVNSIYNDTILNRVYTNVARGNALGFEIGADLHPVKWWALYLGGNIYRQEYTGDLIILNNPALKITNSGWVYSVNVNTTFHLTSTLSLQLNVNYLSDRPTAQGEDSRYLSPHMSLTKDFLNKRLTAGIKWEYIDLGMHESNRQRITTRGEHFYTTTNYIYETDFITLHLSYNLNISNRKNKLPASEFGEKEF